jgi:hypothetical protein
LRHWSEKFGVSPERLKEAVASAGPIPDAVARHLQNSGRKSGPAVVTDVKAWERTADAPEIPDTQHTRES